MAATAPSSAVLRAIAKELDGASTPTAQSPRKGAAQPLDLDLELEGVRTPPDSPKAKKKKKSTKPKPLDITGTPDQDPQLQGEHQPGQNKEHSPTPDPEPSPQPKLEHALYINSEGKLQVRVFDTLEIRAAFLHYCNSRCRPDEMHRIQQLPHMSAQQFMAACKDLELAEPAGPLSPMLLGLTFTTRQDANGGDGLSYVGFMDALMDLSLETARNVAAKLQESFKDWQAQIDQARATMSRSSDGTLRRSDSLLRAPTLRRSDTLLASSSKALTATIGARASEPGSSLSPHPPLSSVGRLSDAGVGGGPSILQGPGGRFTRAMTLQRSGAASTTAAAAAAAVAAVDASMRRSAEGSAARPPSTRGTLRRSLNGSLALRASAPISPSDLPLNPLHAAVLNIHSPSAPMTPSPPSSQPPPVRAKSSDEEDEKKTMLPLVSPTGAMGRPASGRPVGVPPKTAKA